MSKVKHIDRHRVVLERSMTSGHRNGGGKGHRTNTGGHWVSHTEIIPRIRGRYRVRTAERTTHAAAAVVVDEPDRIRLKTTVFSGKREIHIVLWNEHVFLKNI